MITVFYTVLRHRLFVAPTPYVLQKPRENPAFEIAVVTRVLANSCLLTHPADMEHYQHVFGHFLAT